MAVGRIVRAAVHHHQAGARHLLHQMGHAALVVWRALAPGEEVFNDQILIYSQKQKVALDKLLVPRSLLTWAQ